MECVIDRFEGDYAVIGYRGNMLNLPKVFLPVDIREGDVVDIIITVDKQVTEELRNETEKNMADVWES